MVKNVEKYGINMRKIWDKRLNHRDIADIISPDGQTKSTVSSDCAYALR